MTVVTSVVTHSLANTAAGVLHAGKPTSRSLAVSDL
jgi:hypothetical protein